MLVYRDSPPVKFCILIVSYCINSSFFQTKWYVKGRTSSARTIAASLVDGAVIMMMIAMTTVMRKTVRLGRVQKANLGAVIRGKVFLNFSYLLC